MQPRLERLEPMLGSPLFESLLWGHEYDLGGLNPDLRERIQTGQFKRIVFYGMGCSSVVSDIVKGFFLSESIPLQVNVVNDYDVDWFVDREVLKDPSTLTIIVCYSGWSVEPCLFYNTVRHGMAYADPGASYYEERYRQRVLTNLRRRAKSLGYVLQVADPTAGLRRRTMRPR